MIIRIIPETDAEKASMRETEHSGVLEFFVFGNRKDEEGQIADFHTWRGNHRYLMGCLDFFYEVINDERRSRSIAQFPKEGVIRNPPENNIKLVEVPQDVVETPETPENPENHEIQDILPMPGFELVDNEKDEEKK